MVALAVEASTLVRLVGEVEAIAAVHHELVEAVALFLEVPPVVDLVLGLKGVSRHLFVEREELCIQSQSHLIDGVEDIQTQVTIVMVP